MMVAVNGAPVKPEVRTERIRGFVETVGSFKQSAPSIDSEGAIAAAAAPQHG